MSALNLLTIKDNDCSFWNSYYSKVSSNVVQKEIFWEGYVFLCTNYVSVGSLFNKLITQQPFDRK